MSAAFAERTVLLRGDDRIVFDRTAEGLYRAAYYHTVKRKGQRQQTVRDTATAATLHNLIASLIPHDDERYDAGNVIAYIQSTAWGEGLH